MWEDPRAPTFRPPSYDDTLNPPYEPSTPSSIMENAPVASQSQPPQSQLDHSIDGSSASPRLPESSCGQSWTSPNSSNVLHCLQCLSLQAEMDALRRQFAKLAQLQSSQCAELQSVKEEIGLLRDAVAECQQFTSENTNLKDELSDLRSQLATLRGSAPSTPVSAPASGTTNHGPSKLNSLASIHEALSIASEDISEARQTLMRPAQHDTRDLVTLTSPERMLQRLYRLRVLAIEATIVQRHAGLVDPTLYLHLEDQTLKTTTKSDTYTPVWNEWLEFTIPHAAPLAIELMDEDIMGSSCLGSGEVPLEFAFLLELLKGPQRQIIHLKLDGVDTAQVTMSMVTVRPGHALEPEIDHTSHEVT